MTCAQAVHNEWRFFAAHAADAAAHAADAAAHAADAAAHAADAAAHAADAAAHAADAAAHAADAAAHAADSAAWCLLLCRIKIFSLGAYWIEWIWHIPHSCWTAADRQ